MGSQGGEDSRCHGRTETGGVWDQQGRQSDHKQTLRPHIRPDKPRGLDSQWWRVGQAEQRVPPCNPIFAHRQNGQTAGSKADCATQGSSAGK